VVVRPISRTSRSLCPTSKEMFGSDRRRISETSRKMDFPVFEKNGQHVESDTRRD